MGVNLKTIAEVIKGRVVCGSELLDRDIHHVYCGDLLSDVMSNAQKGSLWVTIQGHQNIIAVAVLKELSGIVLSNGQKPDDITLEKAQAELMPIIVTEYDSYIVCGKIFSLGVGR